MNGETFRAYVEQILAPTLKRGDIAFMDNVPIHKVAGVPPGKWLGLARRDLQQLEAI
jgi:transposase